MATENEREQIIALAGEPFGFLDAISLEKVTPCDVSKDRLMPIYTADQVLAARKPLEEEVERLKADMGRQAEECLKLYNEGTRLRQQLAEKDAEIAMQSQERNAYEEAQDRACEERDDARQQLAAAQADNERLRKALEHHQAQTRPIQQTIEAIAQPSDTSALEAMIAKAGEVMRARALGAATWPFDAPTIRGEIRALPGVTLADIPR